VFGLFALIEAVVVRFALELGVKKLANRFTEQMQKIKEGDFSILIIPREYGLLGLWQQPSTPCSVILKS
jgi:hypothetical protein